MDALRLTIVLYTVCIVLENQFFRVLLEFLQIKF